MTSADFSQSLDGVVVTWRSAKLHEVRVRRSVAIFVHHGCLACSSAIYCLLFSSGVKCIRVLLTENAGPTSERYIGSRAAVFKGPLLSVDVSTVSQKIPPACGFLTSFPNSWEFIINFLHTSTLVCKFLFNYLQFWRSYAILSETTHRIFDISLELNL